MWKWISRRCEKGKVYDESNEYVEKLKRAWLKKNNIEPWDITCRCFFCHYASPPDSHRDTCSNCPVRKVDKDFHCATDKHSWQLRPRLFYAELKRLNKIRLERKSK
jgi:hypothetical protein